MEHLKVNLDEHEQYIRHNIFEINRILLVPNEDPAKLVLKMANLDVELGSKDIPVAHRLPSINKVKDYVRVNIVHGGKQDEIYKNWGKQWEKYTKDPSTVCTEPDSPTISQKVSIHINESWTPYRKILFGKILDFNWRNQYKFLWTTNEKIMVKKSDSSSSLSLLTVEQTGLPWLTCTELSNMELTSMAGTLRNGTNGTRSWNNCGWLS